MTYAYGMARAIQDKADFARRVREASDEELTSYSFRLKLYLRALWLGITAPLLFTQAGKGYAFEIDKS